MSYQLHWDEQVNTALIVIMGADWSWQDFIDSTSQAYDMIRTVDHQVPIIITGVDVRMPPGNVFGQLQVLHQKRPPNVGGLIFVNATTIIRMVTDIFGKVYRKAASVHFVATLEEARAIAAQQTASAAGD